MHPVPEAQLVVLNSLPLTQQFPKQLRMGVRWINPNKMTLG
jgi:hypothetical protein